MWETTEYERREVVEEYEGKDQDDSFDPMVIFREEEIFNDGQCSFRFHFSLSPRTRQVPFSSIICWCAGLSFWGMYCKSIFSVQKDNIRLEIESDSGLDME